MAFKRRFIEEPRIELTPMIDVVFLLLVFFMISTTFIETPGITIDLPESSALQKLQDGEEIQVYLAQDGTIYYRQNVIDLETLQQQLHSYGAMSKRMTFLLMADRGALHGRVIQLMDAAKSAGFGKLAIATDQQQGTQP